MNRIKFIIVILIIILQTSPILAVTDPITGKDLKDNREGGLRLRNDMYYKKMKKDPMQTESPEMAEMFEKIKARKESGMWGLKMEEMDGLASSYTNNGKVETTVGRNEGGLNSIPSKFKSTYRLASNLIKGQANKFHWDLNSKYLNSKDYQDLLNNNLATQFDITSPGSFMTAEQWKAYVKKMRPTQKYDYNIKGQKINMYSHEMYSKLIDAIFKVSREEMQTKGRTLNPDFLVALTIHETGFGSNSLSRKHNAWFSINATNENTVENAKKFDDLEYCVRYCLPIIYNFANDKDWRFDDTKGPSMLGANTTYALSSQDGPPSFDWSKGISYYIKDCAKYNNVQIPQF